MSDCQCAEGVVGGVVMSSEVENIDGCFLTGREIAQMFRVSNSTVNLWKKQGMPFYGKSSCARFLKADVMIWQREQNSVPSTKGKRKPVIDESAVAVEVEKSEE